MSAILAPKYEYMMLEFNLYYDNTLIVPLFLIDGDCALKAFSST